MLFILFGGFFIQSNNIPVYLAWFRFLSLFQYTGRILLRNEFADSVYQCDQNITACGGENATYAGYNELVRMGIEDTEYWVSYLVLACMVLFYRTLTFLSIYYFHVERR